VRDCRLTSELARATEVAAIAAARFSGKGNEMAADRAAEEAMRETLREIAAVNGIAIRSEGELGSARILELAPSDAGGPEFEIVLDPLEGTTLCAKAMPGAMPCLAMGDAGALLRPAANYMSKIAIGPGYAEDTVDLDRPPQENVTRLAKAKGVDPREITACVLDRPRHGELVAALREVGARVRLIADGDIAGVIHVADPQETGIDIYLGVGGAAEGVLAAAALRCIGGHLQGRLAATGSGPGRPAGGRDQGKKLMLSDLASGDVMFAASGVTDGPLLKGVRFEREWIETESVVMRSATGTVRWIRSRSRAA
jgi:fructose-1,6-bisphosphatase II / sedoheptulose-1,7-bisphosphatase